MRAEYHSASRREVGHGGMKCPCCRPADKRQYRRRIRARMKAQLLNVVQEFKN